MIRRRAFVAVLCLFVIVLAPRADAVSYGWAGVAVVHGNGKVKVDCVRLDRPEMSGLRLLKLSRFEYFAAQYSFGPGVCWIDGEGVHTTNPDRCYTDPDGKFWSYFNQDKGQTSPTESGMGPKDRVIRRGSIDYWKWNVSTYPDPQPPPEALTMKDICGR